MANHPCRWTASRSLGESSRVVSPEPGSRPLDDPAPRNARRVESFVYAAPAELEGEHTVGSLHGLRFVMQPRGAGDQRSVASAHEVGYVAGCIFRTCGACNYDVHANVLARIDSADVRFRGAQPTARNRAVSDEVIRLDGLGFIMAIGQAKTLSWQYGTRFFAVSSAPGHFSATNAPLPHDGIFAEYDCGYLIDDASIRSDREVDG
jgi:hypothetical protein